MVVHGQHQAPARGEETLAYLIWLAITDPGTWPGGAERLSDVENDITVSRRPSRSEHHASDDHSVWSPVQVTTHMVTHSIQNTLLQLRSWAKTGYKILANTSCTALLSAGIMQSLEGFDSFVDYASRTYRFLKASREYRRAAQRNPITSGYATEIPNTQGSATQRAPSTSLSIVPSRTEELEKIAAWAGLRLEEVPLLALRLEKIVWRAERIGSIVSEIPLEWAQHRWRRIVTSFQRTKLVLGFVALWRGCFPDLGTAACQQTLVAVMMIFYLGTIYEWVDIACKFFTRWTYLSLATRLGMKLGLREQSYYLSSDQDLKSLAMLIQGRMRYRWASCKAVRTTLNRTCWRFVFQSTWSIPVCSEAAPIARTKTMTITKTASYSLTANIGFPAHGFEWTLVKAWFTEMIGKPLRIDISNQNLKLYNTYGSWPSPTLEFHNPKFHAPISIFSSAYNRVHILGLSFIYIVCSLRHTLVIHTWEAEMYGWEAIDKVRPPDSGMRYLVTEKWAHPWIIRTFQREPHPEPYWLISPPSEKQGCQIIKGRSNTNILLQVHTLPEQDI